MADEDVRDLRYRIVLDRSDVYAAVNDVEQASSRIAQSISGMSAGMVSNALAGGVGGTGFGGGSALSPAMVPAILAQQAQFNNLRFNPMTALAQDAYQQQVLIAGAAPMTAMGPSFTTPGGSAVIDPFRPAPAMPFNAPLDYLREFGPTGAPGDRGRRSGLFGTREGSLWNMAAMFASHGLFGRISNDNLEDRMFHHVERRTERFAQSAASLTGGFLVSPFARPYERMSAEFQQYTAPFIRDRRPGGGLDLRGHMEAMRGIADQVAGDNFFTSREYQDIIRMGGESGLFQFTGSKEQALKAIGNLADTTKTLFKLGIAARDQLRTLDTMLGQVGINALEPKMLANNLQNIAVAAQSAGVSTASMVQMAGQGAQYFGSQGIGMATGAQITALNQGLGGAMFRTGALDASQYAYYGGPTGYGQALTSATASLSRMPLGQAAMLSMFSPNGQNMIQAVQGRGLGIADIVNQAGQMATNPLAMTFTQARMPLLTQHMGSNLQASQLQTMLGAFRGMLPQYGRSPEAFAGFLVANGMPANEANAIYDQIGGAASAAADLERSAGDLREQERFESLRGPSLGRRVTKGWERYFARPAAHTMAGIVEGKQAFADDWMQQSLGIHRYDIDNIGQQAYRNTGDLTLARTTATAEMQRAGLNVVSGSLRPRALDETREFQGRAADYARRQMMLNENLRDRFIAQASGTMDHGDISHYFAGKPSTELKQKGDTLADQIIANEQRVRSELGGAIAGLRGYRDEDDADRSFGDLAAQQIRNNMDRTALDKLLKIDPKASLGDMGRIVKELAPHVLGEDADTYEKQRKVGSAYAALSGAAVPKDLGDTRAYMAEFYKKERKTTVDSMRGDYSGLLLGGSVVDQMRAQKGLGMAAVSSILGSGRAKEYLTAVGVTPDNALEFGLDWERIGGEGYAAEYARGVNKYGADNPELQKAMARMVKYRPDAISNLQRLRSLGTATDAQIEQMRDSTVSRERVEQLTAKRRKLGGILGKDTSELLNAVGSGGPDDITGSMGLLEALAKDSGAADDFGLGDDYVTAMRRVGGSVKTGRAAGKDDLQTMLRRSDPNLKGQALEDALATLGVAGNQDLAALFNTNLAAAIDRPGQAPTYAGGQAGGGEGKSAKAMEDAAVQLRLIAQGFDPNKMAAFADSVKKLADAGTTMDSTITKIDQLFTQDGRSMNVKITERLVVEKDGKHMFDLVPKSK